MKSQANENKGKNNILRVCVVHLFHFAEYCLLNEQNEREMRKREMEIEHLPCAFYLRIIHKLNATR